MLTKTMVFSWTPWGSLPCWGALLIAMTSLQLVTSGPSSRVVYYLHTEPATWNDATAMCNQYGATLITLPNLQATKNSITYVNKNSWSDQFDQLATGFWSGLYKNSTGHMRWQRCADFDTTAFGMPTVDPSDPAGTCYKSDIYYELTPRSCDTRLPYICQRDDGQCWFQPYMDTKLMDVDTTSHTNATTASDEGECGKLCRNAVEQSRECWGFTFEGNNCNMLFTDDPHKYAININTNYFHPEADQTAYIKICTGGWVTPLPVPSLDPRTTARNENCSVPTSDVWDDSLCYCECDQPPVILEAENLVMTIDEKVEQIVKELHVNPSNTSSTRRKKESAEDSRPSAQSMGYFGVGFLTVVFGAICLMDLSVLVSHAVTFCKNAKGKNKTDC